MSFVIFALSFNTIAPLLASAPPENGTLIRTALILQTRLDALQLPPDFSRVLHDYSDGRKGFVVWKDLVEERLG